MLNKYIDLMDMTLNFLPFKVPRNIFIQIFSHNKNIQREVIKGGINDTEEREMLLQATLKEMKLPDWPSHGMDDKDWPNFLNELRKASTVFDIDLSVVEIEEKKRLALLKPLHKIKIVDDLKGKNFTLEAIEI